jgi:putative tricarboxylic transport membrane protein
VDLLSNLGLGFATAASPENLLFCLIGVILGTLIGVLPGIGATATIAMLLPITFQLEPVSSLIMLAGIYYGAQYGGSTTAILINMPGESSSAVTAIDGYQMARKGKAGTALAVAALGSFFAGTVATLLVAIFAPPLTIIALKFGAAEYFSLMLLGLVSAIALAHGSILKALAMVVLGLLLGVVGTDIYTGTPRFTFGITAYADGLSFVALAVGVFGIAEILRNLEGSGPDRSGHQAGGTVAFARRPEGRDRPHAARHHAGVCLGHSARWRGGLGGFCLLHGGKAHLEHPGAVRQRRHRGRCRT